MKAVTTEGKAEGLTAGGAMAWQPGLRMQDPAFCVALTFSLHA